MGSCMNVRSEIALALYHALPCRFRRHRQSRDVIRWQRSLSWRSFSEAVPPYQLG